MDAEKRSYYKTVAIVALSGATLGGLIGTAVVPDPSFSKSLVGALLGGGIAGLGLGLYQKTGGAVSGVTCLTCGPGGVGYVPRIGAYGRPRRNGSGYGRRANFNRGGCWSC